MNAETWARLQNCCRDQVAFEQLQQILSAELASASRQADQTLAQLQVRLEQEQALASVITRIRDSLDLDTIFQATATEVRQLLQADRVGVFRFHPDSGWDDGEFVSEDVHPDFPSALAARVHDHCFGEQFAVHYHQGRIQAVADIYTAGLSECHARILAQFQVRANLAVPLLQGQTLWGLLCIHQCRGPRQWQATEIEFVSQIANHLGVALRQAQILASLRAEIAERQQAEESVQALNRELQQAVLELTSVNRELEAFSYSVSHDLRAPLRSIDGFSQALLEEYGDQFDAIGQDYLNRIRAATQRMGQLIDDLIDLSRLTRSDMHREPVDLSALAQAIAAELQLSNPARSVSFTIQPHLVANGDPRLLHILLSNLLDNAWKFSSKQAHAQIEFGAQSRDAGSASYFLRDNGVGFDMAYVDKLFGVFQRLHGIHEFPGTGIGLATTQRIVHRHGGRVWAEGVVDQGATFYFTLHA